MQTSADVKATETGHLISTDKVQGTAVYNRQGEQVGTVDSLMIDKQSGAVSYAVMGFGGFLGIGEDYYPLPWKSLKYDTATGGYVVDIDKNRLEGAPSYASDRPGMWDEPGYVRKIDDYYMR